MPKKILLVDDDQYIRELYQEVLVDEGFAVDTASNGEEALTSLQEGGYDLVLLDVIMPKLDGLGVLDALSKNPPKQPNGPVLLLTNLGEDPVLQDIRSRGAASYLIKAEMTPDQLLEELKKYLPQN
jgi:CheY-like chemotaxis protein